MLKKILLLSLILSSTAYGEKFIVDYSTINHSGITVVPAIDEKGDSGLLGLRDVCYGWKMNKVDLVFYNSLQNWSHTTGLVGLKTKDKECREIKKLFLSLEKGDIVELNNSSIVINGKRFNQM